MPKRFEGSRQRTNQLKSEMKKIFFVIAAGALMMVSCNKSLSPEAQKAWDSFKEASAKLESEEAVDANFQSPEEFAAGVKAWNDAAQKMKDFATEFSTEQADSFASITAKCAPVIEKATQLLQQAAAQGALEDGAEEEAATEEETEETAEE